MNIRGIACYLWVFDGKGDAANGVGPGCVEASRHDVKSYRSTVAVQERERRCR